MRPSLPHLSTVKNALGCSSLGQAREEQKRITISISLNIEIIETPIRQEIEKSKGRVNVK